MSRRSPSALRDRVIQVVLALVVLALVARLVGLGARVAHQDEARVGYWTLRYLASGRYEYRPIVHGPFIPVVDRHLFALLGPSDFTARLPMALLGAAMPAMALLFRSRLDDAETVAFAALLAANPALLYYSRFMRQDLPLAAFALLTLGLAVRAIDSTGRRRRRYVYAAGLAFGLALTTKENVLLYPVAWAGALFLVVDHRLLTGEDPVETARAMVPAAPPAAIALPPAVRLAGLVAFPGGLAALVAGVSGTAFTAAMTGALVGYYALVRGGTVWHLLGGLPLAAIAVATVVRPAFDPGLTGFVAGVAWLLAAALLADERLFRYRPDPAVTDGGRPVDDPDDENGDGDATAPDDRDAGDDAVDPDVDADTGDGSRAKTPDATAEGATAAEGLTWRRARTGGPRRPGLLPLPPLGVAVLLALGVATVFYAPRGGGYPAIGPDLRGWGLWSALAAGSADGLALVLREATYGTWQDFLRQWAGGAQDHPYIPFFLDFLKTMGAGALTVSLGAVAGTLYDRYGDGPRAFVSFCAYWGFASVVGYPLVTDIPAPWVTVHAIVALAVPAAVALAAVYRLGRDEVRAGRHAGVLAGGETDWATVGAAAVVLVAAGAQVGVAATDGVYLNPQDRDNELVQYAQPASTDMKAVLGDVRAVAGENDGVDVLYYGEEFNSANESDHDQPPAGQGWFDRLPLAYYTELYRAQGVAVTVDSTTTQQDVRLSDAPVVVALADNEDGTVSYAASSIERYLGGYSRYDGQRFLYDSGARSSLVYFVDTRSLSQPAPVYANTGGDERPRPRLLPG